LVKPHTSQLAKDIIASPSSGGYLVLVPNVCDLQSTPCILPFGLLDRQEFLPMMAASATPVMSYAGLRFMAAGGTQGLAGNSLNWEEGEGAGAPEGVTAAATNPGAAPRVEASKENTRALVSYKWLR
jgi:hypothetical protein